jgi:hypothetical protein
MFNRWHGREAPMRGEHSMHIELDERWRVRARCAIELPLGAGAMWNHMRDFAGFCRMDPLHRRVIVKANTSDAGETTTVAYPPRGANLVISHRLFGIGPDRMGRVLRWREGRGYAFSDLSRRGVHAGFPHICSYELRPVDAQRCELTIGAHGVWTARSWPRWLVRWWIRYVLHETARIIRLHVSRAHVGQVARPRHSTADALSAERSGPRSQTT